MEFKEIVGAAEAILFAAGESVTIERLCRVLETDSEEMKSALVTLAARLDNMDSGVMITFADGRVQLCTREQYADHIRAALEMRKTPALSATALETLAVVAYRQPVTKSYIEQVRGVDCTYTITSLTEKGFIEECGRLEVPGRPILHKTTRYFLHVFGMTSLEELPPLAETDVGVMTLAKPAVIAPISADVEDKNKDKQMLLDI